LANSFSDIRARESSGAIKERGRENSEMEGQLLSGKRFVTPKQTTPTKKGGEKDRSKAA